MKNKFALMTAALLLSTACSHHPTQAEVAAPSPQKATAPGLSIETQQVAAEQKADYVAEISFKKNQSELSDSNKQAIQKLIKESQAHGKVKSMTVVTWADSEFPSVNTKKLSTAEQGLANNRNKAIENFISSQKYDFKIKTYSMAERATALKEFIGSAESRIKKSLEVAGIPTTDTTVKFPSKASKSILMMILD